MVAVVVFQMTFLLNGLWSNAFANAEPYSMRVSWVSNQGVRELKSWTLKEINQLKSTTYQEWKGVLLAPLMDQALIGLSIEERAQIDLVILKNSMGAQIQFPRAFTTKYPVLLAYQKQGKPLNSAEVLQSLILNPSHAKATRENLPLESFFLKGLHSIEFSNYREKYSGVFLKLRTDPLALRGEKIFLQNCLACHSGGFVGRRVSEVRQASPDLLLKNHQKVKWTPAFKPRDWRSLEVYFQARLAESAPEGDVQ